MNCQRARDLIPDQAAGVLDPKSAPELRAHLESCPECAADLASLTQTLNALDAMPTPKPSSRVRASVYAAIEQEKRALAAAVSARPPRTSRTSLLFWILQPIAGCALLAVGFLVGNRQHPAAPAIPAPAVQSQPVAAANPKTTEQQIADLQSRLDQMTQLVTYSLQKEPANDRIGKVISASATLKPSDDAINNLIATMTLDPSANVRLNAVQALYPHAKDQVVRTAVISSINHESCPLVQVEMINFILSAHDRDAIPELQKLITTDATDPNVRDSAKAAIAQL